MCLIGSISWLGLVTVVALGWVALGVGRRVVRCSWKVPLVLVAVAAVVAGHKLWNRHSAEVVQYVGIDWRDRVERDHDRHGVVLTAAWDEDLGERLRDSVKRNVNRHIERLERELGDEDNANGIDLGELDDLPELQVEPPGPIGDPLPHGPFHDGQVAQGDASDKVSISRVGLFSLGALALMCFWVLFNRDRKRPFARRAVTTVGLVAAGAILFSLFKHTPTRHVTHSMDRVIRVSDDRDNHHDNDRDNAHDAHRGDSGHDGEVVAARKPEPPRPQRAKRPLEEGHRLARAKRPVPRPALDENAELPPRAAEVPVPLEPATPAAKDVAVVAEAEAAQPAAPAEPAPPADPAPAAEPSPAAATADAAPAADTAAAKNSNAPQPAPEAARAGPDNHAAARNEDQPARVQQPTELFGTVAPVATRATEAEPYVSKPRPAWVDMQQGQLVDSVYRISVRSGRWSDIPDCQRALDEAIKQCADDYIERFMPDGEAAVKLVNIDREFLNEHIKKAEYDEVVSASVGPMHEIHALLEFDDAARGEFHERWRKAVVTERLWYTGSAAAVALALLSTFYGYLKLDQQSGGAHRGRLQIAATLLALIVAAGAVLARWTVVPF